MNATRHGWIKPLARGGYASRGAVYLIVGVFAVLAAAGSGEKKDTEGAVKVLMDQPLGFGLMVLLVIGLAGYVIWRLVQSLLDTDDHGWSPKGLAVRGGLLVSAATYATLGLFALSLMGLFAPDDAGSGGGSKPVADTLAGLVGQRYVALALSLVFAGTAIAHFWKAYKEKYADHIRADADTMQYVHPISKIGLSARGAVFAVISLLLFYRFLNAGGSAQPPGLKDAMEFVEGLPFGTWLLMLLGAGLICFAAYSFIEARWRRINVEDASVEDQV